MKTPYLKASRLLAVSAIIPFLILPLVSFAADNSATDFSGLQISNTDFTKDQVTTKDIQSATDFSTLPPTQDNSEDTAFKPLTQIPQIKELASAQGTPAFFNQLYKIAIGVAAVLAVLMIMYSGFQFMTSQGSVTSNEKAKNRLQNAIFGLVLVLSPVIVFSIVNPKILSLDFTSDIANLQPSKLDPIDTASSSTQSANSCGTQQTKAISGSGPNICSSSGAGYAPGAPSCCPGMSQGNTCCISSTVPKPNAETYAWAIYFQSQVSKVKHLDQKGPFPTSQACQASLQSFITDNQNSQDMTEDNLCLCDKPTNQYPKCPIH